VLASLACSVWLGDKKIVGENQIANTPTKVLAISTRLPTLSLTPTLSAQVTALRSLNVRKSVGDDQPVVGALYNGNPVKLTGNCREGWAEIRWKVGTAWVNADYISKNICSENNK
jgi:uncharacterized protein YraI